MYAGYVPQPTPNTSKCPGCWYRKWCAAVPTTVETI